MRYIMITAPSHPPYMYTHRALTHVFLLWACSPRPSVLKTKCVGITIELHVQPRWFVLLMPHMSSYFKRNNKTVVLGLKAHIGICLPVQGVAVPPSPPSLAPPRTLVHHQVDSRVIGHCVRWCTHDMMTCLIDFRTRRLCVSASRRLLPSTIWCPKTISLFRFLKSRKW